MSSAIVVEMKRTSSRSLASNASTRSLVAVTTPTRSPRASSGTHRSEAIGVWFAGSVTKRASCVTSEISAGSPRSTTWPATPSPTAKLSVWIRSVRSPYAAFASRRLRSASRSMTEHAFAPISSQISSEMRDFRRMPGSRSEPISLPISNRGSGQLFERCRCSCLHDADERQVAILLRDVEAVAHDELVRDREAQVVDLDLALGALRLVEQRAQGDARGLRGWRGSRSGSAPCVAGIDDVLKSRSRACPRSCASDPA